MKTADQIIDDWGLINGEAISCTRHVSPETLIIALAPYWFPQLHASTLLIDRGVR